jgi:hypothetical protein
MNKDRKLIFMNAIDDAFFAVHLTLSVYKMHFTKDEKDKIRRRLEEVGHELADIAKEVHLMKEPKQ